jgi:RNA polymerase sigma-70 factor, ECF subfamily
MEIITEWNGTGSKRPERASSAHDLFDQLLRPRRKGLLLHAQRLTRDASEAEDLVQETLIRAYARIDTVKDTSKVQAWLHTILNNLFINEYWRRKRAPTTFSYDEQKEAERAAYTSEQVEQLIENRLQHAATLRALMALPDSFRVPVYLADVRELSYEEIAAHLSLPLGTVRSRISRGRARLLRSLYTWQDRTTH